MIKTFYFTAIVLCGQIFQLYAAMQQKAQHPILQIIKHIEEPSCGHFVDPETVIISHQGGCTIHHLPTNTVLKKISAVPSPHLALHPNKKLCALSYERKIKIYDTKEGILIWQPDKKYADPSDSDFIASIFEPLDDHITTLLQGCFFIRDFNYKTKGCSGRCHGHSGQLPPIIAFHPIEKIMCYAQNKGYLSFHNTNNFKGVDNISVNFIDQFKARWHTFCQFSSDGSLLLEGDPQSFYIRNINNHELVTMENLQEIIFHSNGQFIITLSQPNNIISYWDLSIRPLNPTISMSCSSAEDNPPADLRHMHNYLSCDPVGENLLVILSRQCLIVPMPFEVIYQPQAKEECIFADFALQHELPKDIRQVLIRTLFTLCKR